MMDTPSRPVFRTPLNFMAAATVFFVGGLVAAPFVIGEAITFFYQPHLLALVHTFTLGWVTATIMGIMYRYVPALTHTRIRFPRLAAAQFVIFIIGALGMIGHFAIGSWVGLWWSAIAMVAAVILFAINLIPCVAPRFGTGIAESGIMIAIVFLLAAAIWGLLLALDKTYNFLGGDLLSNLGGHVALAAVGWVMVAVCAISYRMVPAFVLPSKPIPRAALWQLYALAMGAAALATVLIARRGGALILGAAVVAAIAVYLAIMASVMMTRRGPIDWTMRHALCGMGWLIVASVLGLILDAAGADTVTGNRAACGFAAAGLLGWVSNYIIGMSYRLTPGLVDRVRADSGWRAVSGKRMSSVIAPMHPQLWIWSLFNLGVAAATIGLVVANIVLAEIGAAACAAAAIIYAALMCAILAKAYRAGASNLQPG
ncbi:MAG: hypothetical protein IVW54_10655 [Candidatus Binataceae bacterium]|nr:hypothetical protein [Candidatus Binataceae bacterium]